MSDNGSDSDDGGGTAVMRTGNKRKKEPSPEATEEAAPRVVKRGRGSFRDRGEKFRSKDDDSDGFSDRYVPGGSSDEVIPFE